MPSVLAGAATLALLATAACGKSDPASVPTSPPASPSPTATATAGPVAISGTASDKHFTYTVSKMECRKSLTKDGKTSEPTEGQYCLVDLSVRNTSTEEVWFYLNDQFALDATGKQYEHDGFDAKYLDNFVTQSQLGEGGRGNYVLLFDIAPDVKLTGLQLHETKNTPGIKLTFSL
jgi:hypothetical protein